MHLPNRSIHDDDGNFFASWIPSRETIKLKHVTTGAVRVPVKPAVTLVHPAVRVNETQRLGIHVASRSTRNVPIEIDTLEGKAEKRVFDIDNERPFVMDPHDHWILARPCRRNTVEITRSEMMRT